jgi:hypothetical protein
MDGLNIIELLASLLLVVLFKVSLTGGAIS